MKNELNDKDFDDALRAKSSEYHPTPSADVWEKIDYAIANLEEKKSRRKLFYFRWITAALVIISSSLAIFIFTGKNKSKISEINKSASNVQVSENDKIEQSNHLNQNTNDQKFDDNSAPNSKEKIDSTTLNEINYSNNLITNQVFSGKVSVNNNTIVNNKNLISSNKSNLNHDTILKENKGNYSFKNNNVNSFSNKTNVDSTIKINNNNLISQKMINKSLLNKDSIALNQKNLVKHDTTTATIDSVAKLSTITMIKKDTAINETPLSKTEMDSILKTKQSKWSFGISVLPMLTSIRVSNGQNQPPSNSSFQPTKEFNQPFGIVAGINGLYDLNTKLSIYGAINYYERFVHSEFSNCYVKNSPAPYQSFSTGGGSTRISKTDFQPFFDLNPGADSIKMNVDIKNQYYFLNIPISLQYQVISKKVQLSFMLGANANYFFVRKTSAHVTDLSSGESKILYPQNQIAYEKLHFGLQGGMEIGYGFKKSTFYFSPTYMYSITPFVKGNSGSIYPKGYGLGIGFRYHL